MPETSTFLMPTVRRSGFPSGPRAFPIGWIRFHVGGRIRFGGFFPIRTSFGHDQITERDFQHLHEHTLLVVMRLFRFDSILDGFFAVCVRFLARSWERWKVFN